MGEIAACRTMVTVSPPPVPTMPGRAGPTTVGTVRRNVDVRDDPVERRFEAYVDEAFEGHGVGSVMVRRMLDAIREDGDLEITVLCPFVAAWLRRHPHDQELVHG